MSRKPVIRPSKRAHPAYVTASGIVYTGWKRRLWGVVRYTKGTRDEERSLCGQAWDDGYKGNPACVPAPLLFVSLLTAQAWCRGMHNKYALGGVELCKHWRFRPVQVLDTTEVIKA